MPDEKKHEKDLKLDDKSRPMWVLLYQMLMRYQGNRKQHEPDLSFERARKFFRYVTLQRRDEEQLQKNYERISHLPPETFNEEIVRLERILGIAAEDEKGHSDNEDDSASPPQELRERCQTLLNKHWQDHHFNWEQVRELTLQGGELDQVLKDIDGKLKQAGLKKAMRFYRRYLAKKMHIGNQIGEAFWSDFQEMANELEERAYAQLAAAGLLFGAGEGAGAPGSIDDTDLRTRFWKLWDYLRNGDPENPHSADDILGLCRGLCGVVAAAGDMPAAQLHGFWSRFPSPVDSDDWNCAGGTYTRFSQSLVFGNCFYVYRYDYALQHFSTWRIARGNEVHGLALAPALMGLTIAAEKDTAWKTPLANLCADQLLALYTRFGAETLQQAIVDDLSEVIQYGNSVIKSWWENLKRMEAGEMPPGSVPRHLNDLYLDQIIQASPLLRTLKVKKQFECQIDRDFVIEDGQPVRINVSNLIKACIRGLRKLKILQQGPADDKQATTTGPDSLSAIRWSMCQLLPGIGRRLFGLYPWLQRFEGQSKDGIARALEAQYNEEQRAEASWLLPLSPLHFQAMAEEIGKLLLEFNDLKEGYGGKYQRLMAILVPILCDEVDANAHRNVLQDIDVAKQCLNWLILRGADFGAFVRLFNNVMSKQVWEAIKKDKLVTDLTALPYNPHCNQIIEQYGDCLEFTNAFMPLSDNYECNLMGYCINTAVRGVDIGRICDLIRAMTRYGMAIYLAPCVRTRHNNNIGETPFQIACRYKQWDILRLICGIVRDKQEDIPNFNFREWLNGVGKRGESSVLFIPGILTEPSIVKFLCGLGADKEARNGENMTPLHIATLGGHVETVRVLCEQRADKEARSGENMTPLHIATLGRHVETVRVLCEQGAEKEARGLQNMTPLHIAVLKGRAETVRVLCEQGADKEARHKGTMTPLQIAVREGHAETVRVLCEQGADKEAKGENNMTPLHFAAWKGFDVIARILLEQGADKEARAEGNITPLQIAVRCGHADVVQLLSEWPAPDRKS